MQFIIQDVMKNTATVALLNHSMKEMIETVSNEKIARGKMKYVGVIHDEVIGKLTAMDKALNRGDSSAR
ncbi:hypothetical protein [Pasteurella multocida]|uniref:hypothetical protein n=1 Tax=Pasteurella multocida TaxID=747 RepID=UPI001F08841E|nr:hypothetical protein [Pasteurella multocida]